MNFLRALYPKLKGINKAIHIIFLVSLIFILHHKTHLLNFFDKLALTITSILETSDYEKTINNLKIKTFPFAHFEDKQSEIKLDIFLISKKDYTVTFGSISPLDRCYLANILREKLLSNTNIKKVIFDIDISPICQNSQTPLKKEYLECQNQLNEILRDFFRRGGKIITIPPKLFQYLDKDQCNNVKTWKEEMEKKFHVKFLSPNIIAPFGIALYYPQNSLGSFILESEKNTEAHDEHYEEEGIVINYKDFNLKIGQSGSDTVFVGGIYDPRDYINTPVGKLPGVLIHALGYLSILKPINMHSTEANVIAFSLDLLTAILISLLFGKLWHLFLKAKFSYEKFIIFSFNLILVAALILGFSIIIRLIYFKLNIFISIIPILISLFFDSFNGSIIEVIEEKEEEIHVLNDSNGLNLSFLLELLYQLMKLSTIIYAQILIFG